MKKSKLFLIAMIVMIFAMTAVLGLAACQKKDGPEEIPDVVTPETPETPEVVYYDGGTALLQALTTALQNAYTFSAELEYADLNGRDSETYSYTGAGNSGAISASSVYDRYAEYMGVREKFSGNFNRDMLITVDGEKVLGCYYDGENRSVSMDSWEYYEGYTPLDYLLGGDVVQIALKIAMSDASLMTLTDGVYQYSGTLTEEDIDDFSGFMPFSSNSSAALDALENLTITVSKNTIEIATSYITDEEVKEKITFHSGAVEVDKSIYTQFYNTDNDCDVDIDGVEYWFNAGGEYEEYEEAGWVAGYGDDAGGDVVIPSEIAGYPVIAIGYEAFCDNEYITSAEIPSSVIYISEDAFQGCTKLTSVKLNKGLKKIYDYAFDGCVKLTSVTLPEGLEYIGECAFSCCERLASINIPDSVTQIGNGAFYDTVGYESDSAGFEKLVDFDANGVGYVGNWAVAHEFDWYETSGETFVLREGTIGIADWLFQSDLMYPYCSDYEGDGDIWDGDNVGLIKLASLSEEERGYFYETDNYICVTATGAYKVNEVINDSLYSTLSEGARDYFQPCYHRYLDGYPITGVSVPESLKYIGEGSFADNYSLKTVSVFKNGEPTYTIPNLVKIGRDAFYYCGELEKLVIPASCTTIEPSAFYNCYNLYLNFADIGKLQDFRFGNLAIDYDENNNGEYPVYPIITAPGLEIKNGLVYIGSVCYGIYDEFSDEKLNIAAGTTEIADEAFGELNAEIYEIKLPNGLTTIGAYAFCAVDAGAINLPASLTEIGEYAFYRGYGPGSYRFDTVVIDSAMFAALDLRGLYEIGFRFAGGAKVYYKTGLTPSAELLPYLTKLTLSGKTGYTAYTYSDDSDPVDCGEIETEENVEIEFFTGKASVYSFGAAAETEYVVTILFKNNYDSYYVLDLIAYYFEEDDDGEFVLIDGKYVLYDEENDDHIGEQRYNKNDEYGSDSWCNYYGMVEYYLTAPDSDGLIYLEFSISYNYNFETPKATFSVAPRHTSLALGGSAELLSRTGTYRYLTLNVTEDEVGKTYFFYSEGDAFLSAEIRNGDDWIASASSESYRLGNFILNCTFGEPGTYDLRIYRGYGDSGKTEQSLVKIYSVEKSEEILGGEDGEREVAVSSDASYIYVVKNAFKNDGKVYRPGDELTQDEFSALDEKYADGSYTYKYYDRAMAVKITYTFEEAGYYLLSLTAGETCSLLTSGVNYMTFDSATGNENRSFTDGMELIYGDASPYEYDEGAELYNYYGGYEYSYFDAGTITFYITAAPDGETESFSVILSVMKGLIKSDVFPD